MTDAEKIPGRPYVEPVVFSLRDQIKKMGLAEIVTVSGSLDSVWSYVLDDTNFEKTTFPKPGRVLAYELKAPNWDGQGKPPAITSDGKLEPKVGMELRDFAKDRTATKTNDWILSDLWIVSAPYKWQAIVS